MARAAALLVFDWDGTLMDSEVRIVASMAAAIERLELEPRTALQIREIIGLGLPEAVEALFPNADGVQRTALIAGYRHQFLFECSQQEQLFEGAGAVLRELAERGFRLAVATGKSRAGLERALRNSGLQRHFQTTRCADEAISKPHPQMLEEIMLELASEPETTIMIGDTAFDLQMARNAGVASLAASYGVHPLRRLMTFEPLGWFDDLRELPELLDALDIAPAP